MSKFSLRLNVTQLRVSLLVFNLMLGFAVPAYAAYRYYFYSPSSDNSKSSVTIVDLNKFAPKGDEGVSPRSSAAERLMRVAPQLQPKAPAPPDAGPTEGAGTKKTDPDPTKPDGTPILEPGPLGETYEFSSGIFWSDPTRNMVVLHKKDQAAPPVGTAAQGSSKTNPRLKSTVKAVQRGGRNVRAGQAQQGEFITFRVYERRYKNAELGLDFYIDSADQKQFVYWMNPPGPKHMYALPYVSENHYDAHKDEGIRAMDVAQEGADPADPKKYITIRDAGYEFSREKEYAGLKNGTISLTPSSAPTPGGLRDVQGEEGSGTTPATGKASALKPVPGKTSGRNTGAPNVPKKMTPQDSKDLNEAIKNIPPEEQKKLIDGLRKGAVAAPK
ncbi:MAG TPA: hypothetical protein VFD71_12635 [Planctomycetota bacterium]|nr:hypothetical protein [Planctomycetota bacterium]